MRRPRFTRFERALDEAMRRAIAASLAEIERQFFTALAAQEQGQ